MPRGSGENVQGQCPDPVTMTFWDRDRNKAVHSSGVRSGQFSVNYGGSGSVGSKILEIYFCLREN